MARRKVYEWSTTPPENDFPPADGGWVEGMPRSLVNDAARNDLSSIREWYNNQEWIVVTTQGPEPSDVGVFSRVSETQVQINLSGQDLSVYFNEGRIIRIVDGIGEGEDLVTQVESSSYSDPITTINVRPSASIGVEASDVLVFHSSITRALSLVDAVSQFFIPVTPDSAGINAAIIEASASGNGTVLLLETQYDIDETIQFGSIAGRVRMIGAGSEVIIRDVSEDSSLDPMVLVGGANGGVIIENLVFSKGSSSAPGTIMRVDGAIRPNIRNVIFSGGSNQIELSSSPTSFVSIERCLFFGYSAHGIVSSGPTDTHEGKVVNCRFDGGAVSVNDPAAIKLAGRWNAESNTFKEAGSPSLNHRAIWLRNETASNGGQRSVVANNRIDGSNDGATSGTMIEVGGDFTVVSGNRIDCPPGAGRGIFVNGVEAGQVISSVSITGNVVSGASPIDISERSVDVVVTGNQVTADPGSEAILLRGGPCVVSGNVVRGGTVGIHVGETSSGAHISGNTFADHTAHGIDIEGDLATVSANKFSGTTSSMVRIRGQADRATVQSNQMYAMSAIGVELTGEPSQARIWDNVMDGASVGVSIGADVVQALVKRNEALGASVGVVDNGQDSNLLSNSMESNVVTYSDDFTGQPMPNGGGGGRFIALVGVGFRSSSGAGNTPQGEGSYQIRVGQLGSTGDPLILNFVSLPGFSINQNNSSRLIEFTAAAGDTITARLNPSPQSEGNGTVSIFKIGVS